MSRGFGGVGDFRAISRGHPRHGERPGLEIGFQQWCRCRPTDFDKYYGQPVDLLPRAIHGGIFFLPFFPFQLYYVVALAQRIMTSVSSMTCGP